MASILRFTYFDHTVLLNMELKLSSIQNTQYAHIQQSTILRRVELSIFFNGEPPTPLTCVQALPTGRQSPYW